MEQDFSIEERTVSVEEWKQGEWERAVLVDLRDETQTAFGTIPNAVNIPAVRLQGLYDLPLDKKICVFCQKGEISAEIVELLVAAGYDAYHLAGGYLAYLASQFPDL